MKSGGAVLVTAAGQLLIGLCLLGIFEGYKAYYYNSYLTMETVNQTGIDAVLVSRSASYENPMDYRSPMGASYYVAILNNIFAVFGISGILYAQRELMIAFFAYNAAQMVVSFHFFTDLLVDTTINYGGEPSKLNAYEQATTTFIFFNILLSVTATFYAVRSLDEIRQKQREDYNRLSVLGDTPLELPPSNS